MANTLEPRIFQIAYSAQTKAECLDGAEVWDNSGRCDKWFENSVIRALYENKEHETASHVSVLSWRFQRKMRWRSQDNPPRKIQTAQDLKDWAKDNNDIDLLAFGRHIKSANIIRQAASYHKGFDELFFKIIEEAEIPIPRKLHRTRFNILSNYWIMKQSTFADYCENYLVPFMDAIDNNLDLNEAVSKSGQYSLMNSRLKTNPNLFQETGYNYYTLHPFLCERLPTYYAQVNEKLTCKHW